ncbi:MAG: hypothetical protein GC151_16585 [Betaproteobacteria bacterium]|nr:hypothetical protein [Betaproteobacteria bacterium]
MLLRLILIAALFLFIVSLLKGLGAPEPSERSMRRRRAWAVAVRQTAYTMAALIFTGVTAFAAWHAFRFDDRTATWLAVFTGPAALVLAFLAYRASRG